MKNFNMNSEQLKELRLNLVDGLRCSHKPIDSDDIISDLKSKLTAFDNMLWGLSRKSEDNMIRSEDMTEAVIFWLNMSINLEIALSLLEYVDEAFDTGDPKMTEGNSNHFSTVRVKTLIDEYREENANLIKVWEEHGNR